MPRSKKAIAPKHTRNKKKKFWTKERVLQNINILAARIPSGPISFSRVAKMDRNLALNGARLFGDWEAVLIAAGIPEERHAKLESWSKERVLVELRNSRENMRDREFWLRLMSVTLRYFGSVEAALKAAGIEPSPRDQSVFKRQVLASIRERQLAGKSMAFRDVRREDWKLAKQVLRTFGSWEDALEALVIERPRAAVETCDVWNKERVIEKIRILAHEREVDAKLIAQISPKLSEMCMRFFGSVEKAIDCARDQILDAA